MRLYVLRFCGCCQQFVRDSVLHVDDGGDEEEAAAQRDLRRCQVHEIVDRAIIDGERDSVFKPVVEEDDKVSILIVLLLLSVKMRFSSLQCGFARVDFSSSVSNMKIVESICSGREDQGSV